MGNSNISVHVKREKQSHMNYIEETHYGYAFGVGDLKTNTKIKVSESRDSLNLNIYVFSINGWINLANFNKSDLGEYGIRNIDKSLEFATEFLHKFYVGFGFVGG
jgi:hypothetical protein